MPPLSKCLLIQTSKCMGTESKTHMHYTLLCHSFFLPFCFICFNLQSLFPKNCHVPTCQATKCTANVAVGQNFLSTRSAIYLGAFTGTEHTFPAEGPQRPTHKFQPFLVMLGADATKDEMEFRETPEPAN